MWRGRQKWKSFRSLGMYPSGLANASCQTVCMGESSPLPIKEDMEVTREGQSYIKGPCKSWLGRKQRSCIGCRWFNRQVAVFTLSCWCALLIQGTRSVVRIYGPLPTDEAMPERGAPQIDGSWLLLSASFFLS